MSGLVGLAPRPAVRASAWSWAAAGEAAPDAGHVWSESIIGRRLIHRSSAPRDRAPHARTSVHFSSSPTVRNDSTGTAPGSRAAKPGGSSPLTASEAMLVS